VAEEAILDVIGLERLFEQRVVLEVDHAQGQVFTGSPIGVGLAELVGGKGGAGDGGAGGSVGAQVGIGRGGHGYLLLSVEVVNVGFQGRLRAV